MDLTYFGLRDYPFSISPDPRYLYLTPQHTEALAKCQYTIQEHNGLAVIYGDVGTGKTTIARRLYQVLADSEEYNVAMMVTPDLKTDTAFLRRVMGEYGVQPRRSHAASIEGFQQFALESYQQKKNLVLIVDEAQQMTKSMIEVIRIFLNFETDSEKFIQVILFGQNELAQTLDRRDMKAIKSRVAVFGALSSMTTSDAATMISERWKLAGGGDTHPFEQNAINKIILYAHGVPREINKLCNLSLIRAQVASTEKVHSTMVDKAAEELRLEENDE